MLMMTQLIGFGADGGRLGRQFLQSAQNDGGTTANAYTFAGINFGDPSSDRHLLIGHIGVSGGSNATASVLAGSVSATSLVQGDPGPNGVSIGFHLAAVRAGTSGTIVVTFDAAQLRGGIGVWRLGGVGGNPVIDTISPIRGDPPASDTANVPPGGAAFALAYGGATTFTWTGLDEDQDSALLNSLNKIAFASREFPEGVGTHTMAAIPAAGASGWVGVSLR